MRIVRKEKHSPRPIKQLEIHLTFNHILTKKLQTHKIVFSWMTVSVHDLVMHFGRKLELQIFLDLFLNFENICCWFSVLFSNPNHPMYLVFSFFFFFNSSFFFVFFEWKCNLAYLYNDYNQVFLKNTEPPSH